MNTATLKDRAEQDQAGVDRPTPSAVSFRNSDLIISYLEKIGVEYLFGVPGGAIEPLYNALARSEARGGLRSVVSRHETGAAFMADGYTREKGVMGVCCGTTGPGATNLITGVASAYENEIPLLVLTAQTALCTFGKGASQESSCTSMNTLGMFQHCTRYNSLVSHPAQMEHKLVSAIMAAHQSPCGPVHLSVPVDVLDTPVVMNDYNLDVNIVRHRESQVNPEVLGRFLKEVEAARKIVFVVGVGASRDASAVLDLAGLLGAEIVTSIDGKGLISSYHPLYRGVFGFAGHTSAVETLRNPDVDLVVAFGSNLCELASGGWDEESLLNDRLIHVDPVAMHFLRSPMARLQVIGSIGKVCQFLIENISSIATGDSSLPVDIGTSPGTANPAVRPLMPHCTLAEPNKYMDDSVPLKPQRLMRDLGQMFPASTRFLADIGNSFAWATHYLHPVDRRLGNRRSPERADYLDPGRRRQRQPRVDAATYRAGIEFASMGWAIGAAVGTAFANRDCPVVCITGDGSMLMSGQEITVARMEGLSIVFVVLNDAALGMVKHGQKLANAEEIGYELPTVDFEMFARAMGVDSYSIRSPEDLSRLNVEDLCTRGSPTLLDVYIDPDEVPPMGLRVELLNASRRLSEERKNIEQNLERNTRE